MTIIDELKRRKVFRVAATYAIVAWILMQIGEVTFPALNIPDWVMSAIVVVLLFGFPVAVIFAWIFDKTPKGFVKTSSFARKGEQVTSYGTTADSRTIYQNKRNIFLAGGLVIGLAIGWLVPSGNSDKERITERSIAVLPFDNLSDSKEDEYFSDGITEEIITQLSKISDLMVISRTSVLQYKGTMKTISEISQELGVAAILEGSVRRDGDNLRITGQLIDADTDNHLWADTYDRKMENIFEIQTDVATRIAGALKAKISRIEREAIAAAPTENVQAYTLYLKGQTEYFKYTYEGFEKSIDYYKQALRLDPSYALAYSGMGDSYGQMYRYNEEDVYAELSLQSSERALSINVDLAEGHKSKALTLFFMGRISEANELNRKAMELGYHLAQANLAFGYQNMGDLSQSLGHYLKSRQGDPYNLRIVMNLGTNYLFLEAYDDFRALIDDALQKKPDGMELNWVLMQQQCIDGKWADARATVEQLLLLRQNDNRVHRVAGEFSLYVRDYNAALNHFQTIQHMNAEDKTALAYVLLQKWDRAWALTLLDQVIEQQLQRIEEAGDVWAFTRWLLAGAYSVKADKASALKWLEDAVEKGWTGYQWLEMDPRFDAVREEPKYHELIERMKTVIARERIEAGYTT
ncbi:MAG: hypothetical protein CMG71_05090 [Candidatus Marinimicrobia bacterium]|nr:hypothetical protein [Candidatus Neomarinimicrobiota bacterium]